MVKRLVSSLLVIMILCSMLITTQITSQAASTKKFVKAPTSIKVTSVSCTKARISWKKATNAQQYRVYRASSKKGKYKVVGKVKKTKNYFIDKKLKTGSTYYYKVASILSKKKAVSKPVKYKAKPKNVSGVSLKKTGNNALTLKWSKISDVNGYNIVGSTVSNMSKNTVRKTIKNKNTNKCVFSKIATNKNYYVRIRAFKKVGKKTVYGSYSTKVYRVAGKAKVINGPIPKDITKQKVTFKKDNTKKFTRVQWIYYLVHKLNLDKTTKLDNSGYSFSDIKNHKYAKEIEIAYQNDIIPDPTKSDFDPEQDVRKFNPNSTATREFAAYTAVASQGFEKNQSVSLTCSDKASVKYKTQVALAIKNGFMNTVNGKSNGKFNPNSAMTGTDKNQIFAKIDQLKKSISIDKSKIYQNMKYAEKVKQNTGTYTIKKLGDKQYQVEMSGKKNYKVGSVVVLSPNSAHPSGFPIKVVSSSYANNKTVILAGTPDITEVYDGIQFQGCGTANVSKVETAPGVTCQYDKNGTVDDNGYGFDINKEFDTAIPGKLKFSVNKSVAEDVKVKGDVEFSIPSVRARVDAHIGLTGLKMNDLLVSVTKKSKFTGKLEGTFLTTGYEITHGSGKTDFVPGCWELGRLPIALGSTGLSIDVVFNFEISVKGEISLSYTITSTEGIQYTNGSIRQIKEGSQQLSDLTAKASAKIGFKVQVGLWALEAFNIFGMQADLGLGADLSFTPHFDTYCGDGRLYAYLSFGLDTESLFCKATHYELTKDVWTSKDSPYLRSIHIENMRIVDKCSFESGTLEGKIVNAGGKPLYGARVQLSKGLTAICTVYSDTDGSFKSGELPSGDYDVIVSATGYKKYVSRETIVSGQNTFAESYKMITRNGSDGGTVTGDILNATTGKSVDNVSYKVYSGWNNTDSDVVDSGNVNGRYSINLEPGNYTIQFTADNYFGNIINVAVESGLTTEQVVVLNPYDSSVKNNFRIVLTWGEYPLDIDSHLYGPTVNGDDIFHVFYDDDYYDWWNPSTEDYETICDLDVDDTESYGPETITVHKMNSSGTYSYYVHDYSNRYDSDSTELSNSGAIARVYSGNTLLATFNVPTNKVGTVWHVFDYDASTDTIKPVNDFYSQSYPSDVNEPEY